MKSIGRQLLTISWSCASAPPSECVQGTVWSESSSPGLGVSELPFSDTISSLGVGGAAVLFCLILPPGGRLLHLTAAVSLSIPLSA
ncbi:hypothetical protein GDO81_019172 [Engystomops pustulosus]|uniref:Secreted protein n=1 Tax=Engystomops pustulosus TaxID=76066 RepID=A0AAV6YCJ6_ENGPU|nr:hypothetical protein GDO81_019172 [Engystomops pustulosus]